MTRLSGHCLCGALAWETEAAPEWAGYCHCDSCRRTCAAPVAAFFGVPTAALRWMGERARFTRDDVTRSFCPACGTPMASEAARFGPETHLYIAHAEPPGAVVPTFHVHHAEAVGWMRIDDDLPRYRHTSNGGSAPRDA